MSNKDNVKINYISEKDVVVLYSQPQEDPRGSSNVEGEVNMVATNVLARMLLIIPKV